MSGMISEREMASGESGSQDSTDMQLYFGFCL